MRDDIITRLGEQYLPIPMPDEKDLPPTYKEQLNSPEVVRAKQIFAFNIVRAVALGEMQQTRQAKAIRRSQHRRGR